MDTSYPQTVQAALAETVSKIKLAEALATEIPARQPGPSNEASINAELQAARQAIINAGGEPRDVGTLRDYRLTALWVQGVNTPNFQWVPTHSFTAHSEARRHGMSPEEFAANPRNAREIRQERGTGSKDGDPARVVSGWSPEQRKQAAREVLRDPEVAQDVLTDREARISVNRAVNVYQRKQEQEVERAQRDRAAADAEAGRTPLTPTRKWDITHLFIQAAEAMSKLAEAMKDAEVTEEFQKLTAPEHRDIAVAWEYIDGRWRGTGMSLDEGLEALLQRGSGSNG